MLTLLNLIDLYVDTLCKKVTHAWKKVVRIKIQLAGVNYSLLLLILSFRVRYIEEGWGPTTCPILCELYAIFDWIIYIPPFWLVEKVRVEPIYL